MCEVYPRVINTLLPLERPEKSWFRFSTLVSPPYHTFWPYWWKIILVKCKALEIILAGLFMADDVESFIIFPCSWYNFATNLLFVFVCFLFIFKEFNTMECKKEDWDIRFKENSHERGKKRLYSVESKILRYFFLVLVFNNWWIPFSIPLTLSRISCLVYLISILSKSTRNEEKKPQSWSLCLLVRASSATHVLAETLAGSVFTPWAGTWSVSIYVRILPWVHFMLSFYSRGLSVSLNPCGISFKGFS